MNDLFDPPDIAGEPLAETAVAPTPTVPGAPMPNAVQVVEGEKPFYKDSTFWLLAGGGALALWLLLRQPREPAPSFGAHEEPEGADDPEEFFADEKPRRKRRKPPSRKRKALAEVVPEPEGDASEPDPVEAATEVAGIAVVDPPKKPRKRRSKKKALAETAAAPPEEPVGASEEEAEGVDEGADDDAA